MELNYCGITSTLRGSGGRITPLPPTHEYAPVCMYVNIPISFVFTNKDIRLYNKYENFVIIVLCLLSFGVLNYLS